MSQPDLAAQIVSVMLAERDALLAERDALLAQVAALREELEHVTDIAVACIVPGNALDNAVNLLNRTEAAATAYRQQIEREVLNTATDGRFAKYEQQAREQVSEAAESVIAMAIARLGGTVEGSPTARHNFLQRIDELREIELTRGGEPAPARETKP